MDLQRRVLREPKENRREYAHQIEEFCAGLSEAYPTMPHEEKMDAHTSLEFWQTLYREITRTELNVCLSSSRRSSSVS